MNNSWYTLTTPELEKALVVSAQKGLTDSDIAERRARYGDNGFKRPSRGGLVKKFITQVKNPLVILLAVAGAGTFFLGEVFNTIVIGIAVAINIIVGVLQEGRADAAFEKLVVSEERFAVVVRGGAKYSIRAEDLVPGDVCLLTAGAHIPADIRLVECADFSTNESALTGEWLAVVKNAEPIAGVSVRITEQYNMAWKGTLAVSGKALGVVVETGDRTELGKIAQELSYREDTTTPLQKKIKKLARFLAYATLAIIALILVLGISRGESLLNMLLVGIALAVAAVPEGLPAAVTVVLALGMEAILKKGGLVRNLLAAETLGGTTVILTDKTGTLTKAEMRVARIVSVESFDDEGRYVPEKEHGDFSSGEGGVDREVLTMAVLASDAFVTGHEEDALAEWDVQGRPVERAVMLAALESGLRPGELAEIYPRVDFSPFNSDVKFTASLVVGASGTHRLIASGAPEFMLSHSSFLHTAHGKVVMTEKQKKAFSDTQEYYGGQGFRLIAVGYKDVAMSNSRISHLHEGDKGVLSVVSQMIFIGMIVLHDPLRADVRGAVQRAIEAGTRVIMVTGDNKATAETIAREAGIKKTEGGTLTGAELDALSDMELAHILSSTTVIARVLPEQKLRIVRVLKAQGEVVAMTGDGINDAPALRSASIGIALGSGTEVAKEASDLILVNNSFSIIVDAIEEGRRILDNLKKIVAYLLSTGFSEIALIGGALLSATPLPILPAQILWVNILQEGFMNFAFAFEPKERGLMKRNPADISMKSILSSDLRTLLIIVSGVTGVFLVALYFFLLSGDVPIEKTRTIMFAALSVSSMFFALSIKNLRTPIWNIEIFSNTYLLASLGASVLLFAMALYVPVLQKLLSLEPLAGVEIAFIVLIGLFNLVVIEIAKFAVFRQVPKVR